MKLQYSKRNSEKYNIGPVGYVLMSRPTDNQPITASHIIREYCHQNVLVLGYASTLTAEMITTFTFTRVCAITPSWYFLRAAK
jgi:hypothetical protein